MSAQLNLHEVSSQLPVDDRLAKTFDLDELSDMVAHWMLAAQAGRLRWRVAGARSFAFDRHTNRVVASCVQDSLARWWVVIRSTASTHGPFGTRAHA